MVRAYSEALKEAIKKATILELQTGLEVMAKLDYASFEKFKYYCQKNNINIVKTDYLDNITCNIELNEEEFNKLEEDIKNENNLGILSFDKIRQKYISKLSKNVE